jgi:hypothetical protein
MPTPTPFFVVARPHDERHAALYTALCEIARNHDGKIPVLILGPRERRVVILSGEDAVFLPLMMR